ncbi:ISC system 2Fe-2S type ferredoxin [Candidatus Annandia pinicola]|uniref:ISC system 2Fe-2S type ferredoxin n=1 Tax=Candidatus Annandia pinicola TaxID=1345117 RepID=UPI001D01B0F0|nr:ISC system 2Fe-2S type ferredoxin [Candidatus Annandia pinicola]UDG80329.1 2Fe-2S ferredoxin [Candidatus Annandia pinicola]
MIKIFFLPHKTILPKGKIVYHRSKDSILNIALKNGININHACEKVCACTTCHCIIKKGFNSLNKINELESDMLDKAWNLNFKSRLSCQAIISDKDLIIKIPKYNINYVN